MVAPKSVKPNSPFVSAVLVLKRVHDTGGSKLVVASIKYAYSGVPKKFNCTAPLFVREMPVAIAGTMLATVRITLPPLTEMNAVVPAAPRAVPDTG